MSTMNLCASLRFFASDSLTDALHTQSSLATQRAARSSGGETKFAGSLRVFVGALALGVLAALVCERATAAPPGARPKAAPASVSAVARHGQLAVRGNRIVDEHGAPVVLRGMSFFWSQWMGRYYNREAVRVLRDDWKCSVVRAAMGVENGGYLENPEKEKRRVTAVVDAAIELGIYVIIDWHDHNAPQHREQAQKFFVEMATRYGDKPNVIYEIYNEPLNTHSWHDDIKPYGAALIETIRSHDTDNLIVCGTSHWSQKVDEASADPLAGENIVYALHFYAASHRQELRDAALRALKNGAALMVTEFGTCEASGDGALDADETRLWWKFLEENGISWCNWSVADKKETASALRTGASSRGAWSDADITSSGRLVRDQLRLEAKREDARVLAEAAAAKAAEKNVKPKTP